MDYELKKYINLLKDRKRVLCGFNQNQYGEAVVTTGIPREFKKGVITYTHQKTESYDDYMLRQTLKRR